MAVLQQMLIFLCLMLVGIYARRKGMLTEKNQQQISAITVNIAYPAIILSGVGNGEEPMSGDVCFDFNGDYRKNFTAFTWLR